MDSKHLIVIGIPSRSYRTDLQLAVDMFCLIRPTGYTYALCCVVGHDTATARNEIVYRALKKGAKYIFFWDTDVSFTDCDAILSKFLAVMRSDPRVKILSGVYYLKDDSVRPVLWRYNDPGFDGRKCKKRDCSFVNLGSKTNKQFIRLIEVDFIGLGCCLIDCSVFRSISKPYFALEGETTEDAFFFKKARKKGYRIFVDPEMKCRHIDSEQNLIFYDGAVIKRPLRNKLFDPSLRGGAGKE